MPGVTKGTLTGLATDMSLGTGTSLGGAVLLIAATRRRSAVSWGLGSGCGDGAVEPNQGVQFVQLRLRCIVVREARRALHLANDWKQCAIGMLW